jgi:hypothetical protein
MGKHLEFYMLVLWCLLLIGATSFIVQCLYNHPNIPFEKQMKKVRFDDNKNQYFQIPSRQYAYIDYL